MIFPPKEKYRKKSSVARETITFQGAYLEKRNSRLFIGGPWRLLYVLRINKRKKNHSIEIKNSIIFHLAKNILYSGVQSEIQPFPLPPIFISPAYETFFEVVRIFASGQGIRSRSCTRQASRKPFQCSVAQKPWDLPVCPHYTGALS